MMMDWASRAVLSWRLSNTLHGRSASRRWRRPWRASASRTSSPPTKGCQFTAAAFTGTLAAAGVRISMDGRGRWMDNVFIERLWCSLKYEDIYLKGYADGREVKAGIASWITFYKRASQHPSVYVNEEKRFC
jgi:putative transposase